MLDDFYETFTADIDRFLQSVKKPKKPKKAKFQLVA